MSLENLVLARFFFFLRQQQHQQRSWRRYCRMLLQAYGHADDGERREDEVFRVKMKQESLWGEGGELAASKKISLSLSLSSPTLCPFGLRAPLPPPCYLKNKNPKNNNDEKRGEGIGSLCHSVSPYSLPGCSDHSSSSSHLLALPSLSQSPPLLPNVSMEIAA